MRRAVCPGSFDPLHLGHVEVISRAAALYDEVVVAVSDNPRKSYRFSAAERVGLVRAALAGVEHVTVRSLGPGLIAHFCRDIGAQVIVKGLRNAADLEYEAPMAAMNRHLTGVETLYLPADPRWAAVSSSLVKEVHGLGGDVSPFVPAEVLARLDATAAG
ncbi:pantetheine-phosphate adenylyltransferase [Micrococcus sp.]|uniref:pantetheine-phosphate adenylyltransferase n=1 Tax=Micrococcus sp. TaxID=1271 RepID=UPI002A90E27A|nr:pantetheine-phosphate adenylyltransferase [Micrococcus sp.]MDY6055661.1 pantetheine-phosphate adenylyltransferase [Micrococcus sp.]